MISTSALYQTILADAGHSVEWRITINGTIYGMDKIAVDVGGGASSPTIKRHLFSGNGPEVGATVSGTFECTIFEASSAVPRMAAVVPEYRLVLGEDVSEWVTLGTFYIDTRTVDETMGTLSLFCYDRMLLADGANGKTYADVTGFTTWPQSMSAVANEIATIMGISIDSRTVINSGSGYMVDYPNDYTMREVLGYIAAAHCGNWTITPANKLRLIPLTGGTDTLNIGTNAQGLDTSPALAAWSGVTVYYEDEAAFSSGDDTGNTLTTDCVWATQDTADGMLAAITGEQYQPFTAQGAYIDLALELGDLLTVGYPGETVTGAAFGIEITCDVIGCAEVTAPCEQEVDHEYPYSSYVDRSLKRKVTLGQSYYGTEISRDKGLFISRSDGKSDITLNSDLMRFRGLVDGSMMDQLYFDPTTGRYIFNGSLGADAIFTDSLYAEQGDVAELTVDRLSTSARIRKYILGDTSDDNYIRIRDQYLQFVTGTLNPDVALLTEDGLNILTEDGDILLEDRGDGPGVIAATNRYGQPLYWRSEPVSHTADGYPLDADGYQIYATTEATDWPVYMYDYTEEIKAEYAFAYDGTYYVPQIVLGAGDEHGNNKAYFLKSGDGLNINFVDNNGQEIGLKALGTGYLDLYGLRKTTVMDFSEWENGQFSETVDGGAVADYGVVFDDSGRPVKITDASGHETVVVW